MSKQITLLFIVPFFIGCTVLQTADDRRAAERACGVDMLKEPTLEQLYCMEEKGKDMPNYESLAHKIEQKQNSEKDEYEKELSQCKVISTDNEGELVSGVIEAPRTHPIPFIKEKVRRVCEENNRSKFRITNIKITKKEGEDYVQEAEFECS